MTKVEPEPILHGEMYLLFEKVMRERVFYISMRYSKANNKQLKPYYSNQKSKHTITGKSKWIGSKEFDSNKFSIISSKGCVFEFDVEYLIELCELDNNCLHLAPDKIETKK